MRWDNLTIEREEGARLPGYRDPAVVRTFDAPEALGIRFYEVNARSAINAVPKRSRMPFRFTINPYRGCTHACVYCLDGATRILLADGSHRALADLEAGDVVYGTERSGQYRRYVPSTVSAHWATHKQAYLVQLEDGTELIASADHRFLTERGWKFVIGAQQGSSRRPHLTPNNRLLGVGAFSESPDRNDPEYRRGYLCGVLRGDGSWGSYEYERSTRGGRRVHRFRLALADLEALRQTKRFLEQESVETREFAFAAAAGGRRPMQAIRTSKRAGVDSVRALVEWPRVASDSWRKGFLAGIFDAEGSHSRGVMRICNTDQAIVDWTAWCLRHLSIPHVIEDRRRPNRLRVIRITGGLRERMRFLHATTPAITRKRQIDGLALKSSAKLGVASIEPVGVRELYDITTTTGDFVANGVVSHNCFARPTHTYLDLNAREDFEREIVVKVNVPEVLRIELRRPSWKRDHVALGTNTDPYQWVEGRYRLTRGVWEAMRDFANPCSVLTKSPLLLRDLDVFRELVERTDFSANLSIPTLDEKAWRATEPHTPHPRKRIEAVAELVRNGIPAGVLVAPLIPGVNDDPEQVEELLGLLGEAGADSVSGIGLHLRGEVKEIWFDWLRQYRPDLVPRYERLYRRGAYLPKDEAKRLSDRARGPSRPRRLRGQPAPEPEPPTAEPSPAAQPKLF